MKKKKYSQKTKAHKIYILKNGTIVPGVTSITAELGWNKEALIAWANKLGLQGHNSREYKDEKATIGKLAHKMITDWFLKQATVLDDYSKNQINEAENSVLSFFEWMKGKEIKPILIEKRLVSEIHKFGGQADIYAQVNGNLELIDLKTGSGIYDEMIIQVSAYKKLLEENGHKVDKVRILNIPRSEDESFKEVFIDNHEIGWQIFLNCLSIYNLKKRLK